MLSSYLTKLRAHENLAEDEAAGAMEAIMTGRVEPDQIEEYLILLADKGETADEIAGSAKIMRAHAVRIHPKVARLVDTCGTGGDKSNTFNISTTVAFVVAGASGRLPAGRQVAVAKHGNKAVSSRSGSANVLEALGVKIDLSPEKVREEIEEIGIGFMFAPLFHPAMKFVAPVRAKLKRRTIFNLLGPVTNPAGAGYQIIGVFDKKLVRLLAEVLAKMGHEHALVVHGDGLDEITTTGITHVAELRNGVITEYDLTPEDVGFARVVPADLLGGDAEENAKITREILSGVRGPRRDIVVLNSAAALVASEVAPDLKAGILLAEKSLDSGAARKKLEQMIEWSAEI